MADDVELREQLGEPEDHATWPDVVQTLVQVLALVAIVGIVAWTVVNHG